MYFGVAAEGLAAEDDRHVEAVDVTPVDQDGVARSAFMHKTDLFIKRNCSRIVRMYA
ncbi:hypothetical protein D3C78_1413160 [compost metagenome]